MNEQINGMDYLTILKCKTLGKDISLNCSRGPQSHKKTKKKQEGFLRCESLTSSVRLKVEGCRVKNGGCMIEAWRV